MKYINIGLTFHETVPLRLKNQVLVFLSWHLAVPVHNVIKDWMAIAYSPPSPLPPVKDRPLLVLGLQ